LRQAALDNRPWESSTGPKTIEGKARASGNGRSRQRGPISIRQLRTEVASIHDLAAAMQAARARLLGR
jgi:hypothetical protein